MEQKLTDFFPFHTDVDTAQKLIYLSDQQSMSGQFLFNLMLEKYIAEQRVVHIISVSHKRHHYDAILRKLSYDLLKLEADGMVVIHYITAPVDSDEGYDEDIDVSELFINVTVGDTHPETKISLPAVSLSPQAQGRRLVQTVTEACLKDHPNRVVMIDDLIALDVIMTHTSIATTTTSSSTSREGEGERGADTRYALAFLYDFQTLLSLKKLHSVVCYSDDPVAAAHSHSSLAIEAFMGHTSSEGGGYSDSVAELCKYRADISVIASKLDSGYSADVHGQLLITTSSNKAGRSAGGSNKAGRSAGVSHPHQQRLLFKTSDAGVKCAQH